MTGCGTDDVAAAHRTAPTRMSVAQAQAMMTAYDARNADALRATSAPSYSERAWRSVDAGEILASDIYATRIAKAAKDRAPVGRLRHTVDRVLGEARSAGRDTVVMTGTMRFHRPAGGGSKAVTNTMKMLWSMQRAGRGWRLADEVILEDAALPARTGDGTTSSAVPGTSVIRAAAGPVIDALQVDRYDGLGAAEPIKQVKRTISIGDDVYETYSCYPRSASPGTRVVRAGSPDVVVLPHGSSTLMVLRLRCDVVHHTNDNRYRITVPAPQARVDHLPRSTSRAGEGFAVTLLVQQAGTGRPGVLAATAHRVLRIRPGGAGRQA